MPYEPPPELAALTLAEIAAQVAARKLPPIEQWTPARDGDSHMRITADGTWLHEGSPITRTAMVRAFSSLLTRDADGAHWLVTPHERLAIAVDDAAFIAVDAVRKGGGIAFRLNTDDLVVAGADHPLRATGNTETPALYLGVRGGLEARLNRSTYAQLAEIALAEGEDWSVTSMSARFSLIPE